MRHVLIVEAAQHVQNGIRFTNVGPKPVMYVCNVDEASAVNGNKYVEMVREAVKEENAEILVVAAKTEADIAELETYEDRQMFLQKAAEFV